MHSAPDRYPAEITVQPLAAAPAATVRVPGSKSITNRALVLAAMGGVGSCTVSGALRSEDTEVMLDCLSRLGFAVQATWDANPPEVVFSHPEDWSRMPSAADLFVGNSGTTVRFLTAMLSLARGRFRLDGVPRMRERPIEELLDGLRQLGVRAYSEAANGCPPVVLEANRLAGGLVRIKGDRSSQFLSALLLAAPFADAETVIEVDGSLVSTPYVAMTVRMLRDQRYVIVEEPGPRFRIPPRQSRQMTGRYEVEPDASTASYFFGAAAVTGGRVTVEGLGPDSMQGDVGFLDALEAMGCRVERCSAGITVHGRPMRGIEIDMNGISDTVMTLAAVACFAEGPTTVRNVAHIRHKETDRLAAMATELRKVGAGVEEFADGLRIDPGRLHGTAVDTYNDHRMAMSMALIGLKIPGIVIRNPGCVAKTYPDFWRDLERLRGHDAERPAR